MYIIPFFIAGCLRLWTQRNPAQRLLNEDRRQLTQAGRLVAPQIIAPVHSSQVSPEAQQDHV